MLNRAYIFIGSNVDRETNYLEALRRLAKLGALKAGSNVYETEPVGNGDAECFYNGSVLIETPLTARALKDALKRIEVEMGRVRTANPNAPRTIDLDLVLFNQERLQDGDVRVPDPLILERPFLAKTLAEISPDYVLPGDGRTLAQIARSFGSSPPGMRLDPEMTEKVKPLVDHIYTGEYSHA